jgi:hypothetical protein
MLWHLFGGNSNMASMRISSQIDANHGRQDWTQWPFERYTNRTFGYGKLIPSSSNNLRYCLTIAFLGSVMILIMVSFLSKDRDNQSLVDVPLIRNKIERPDLLRDILKNILLIDRFIFSTAIPNHMCIESKGSNFSSPSNAPQQWRGYSVLTFTILFRGLRPPCGGTNTSVPSVFF